MSTRMFDYEKDKAMFGHFSALNHHVFSDKYILNVLDLNYNIRQNTRYYAGSHKKE